MAQSFFILSSATKPGEKQGSCYIAYSALRADQLPCKTLVLFYHRRADSFYNTLYGPGPWRLPPIEGPRSLTGSPCASGSSRLGSSLLAQRLVLNIHISAGGSCGRLVSSFGFEMLFPSEFPLQLALYRDVSLLIHKSQLISS